jgi:hypothetical protein
MVSISILYSDFISLMQTAPWMAKCSKFCFADLYMFYRAMKFFSRLLSEVEDPDLCAVTTAELAVLM